MTGFHLTRIAFHRFIHRPSIPSYLRRMSFATSVAKLRSPVKELVLSASENGEKLVGNDDAEKQEVIGWIDKAGDGKLATENNLKVCYYFIFHKAASQLYYVQDLDALLIPKTYVATNYLTAADVALYGTLHPIIVCSEIPFFSIL